MIMWFDRHDQAALPHDLRHQAGEVTEVSTYIDGSHAWPQVTRYCTCNPGFPVTVVQQTFSETTLALVYEHVELTEHSAQSRVVVDFAMLTILHLAQSTTDRRGRNLLNA